MHVCSLLLLLAGIGTVAVAVTNRIVRLRPPAVASAGLTESGRAALTTFGGSVLIAAIFLALAGV